jgi:hypothetical protein
MRLRRTLSAPRRRDELKPARRWNKWYLPYRTIGRFFVMRRIYSWLAANGLRPANDAETLVSPVATIFPSLDVDQCRTDMLRGDLHLGPQLPQHVIDSIAVFASTAPCRRPGFKEVFSHSDVTNGCLADGRHVAIADVLEPMACPAVAKLCEDAGLRRAASACLGYPVNRVEIRLYWSFAASLSDYERRALLQTIDFHYDVPWFNSVYAYFYLTRGDKHSGAHVLYRGSARNKPLHFKISSAFQTEEALSAYYGEHRQAVIEGPQGQGFFENPFAYHKALPPIEGDRLMLQLRYY